MTKQEVRIGLAEGLDVSPIALLVQIASNYESDVFVEVEEKRISAKSIMGMMTLGLQEGKTLVIAAEGKDEEAAVKALTDFLGNYQKRSEES